MKRTPVRRSVFLSVALAVLVGMAVVGPRAVRADAGAPPAPTPTDPASRPRAKPLSAAGQAEELIIALDYERARSVLAKADPNDPDVVVTKARLALYEEDCDLASALLSRTDLGANDEARLLGEVARGCARVTAATVVDEDRASGVVIRYQDDADQALSPLLVETVRAARETLARDLGVVWKAATHITVVRDLLSLSAMTGLPYESAQTTGTVAVAKWGRVTMLSPRASAHGFPFRDTLTHEMTHLAIAMQTQDRAPLWLHEGLARREEARWRAPSVFDDKPPVESVVLRGMELKMDLPLDKLGPSIGMLPSAEAATVAFAEVTSFVRFFAESSKPTVIPELLVALRDAKTPDDALQAVSGARLPEWDARWRAHLAKRPKEPVPALLGLGPPPPGLSDSRERARLAELLLGRRHVAEAQLELDKIPADLMADTSLRYLRARAFELEDKADKAWSVVEDPKAWVAAYGPCWAIRGRLARQRGDEATASSSFHEALAQDPLAVESACQALGQGSLEPAAEPALSLLSPEGRRLCDAARQRREPDLGQD